MLLLKIPNFINLTLLYGIGYFIYDTTILYKRVRTIKLITLNEIYIYKSSNLKEIYVDRLNLN